jgi:hypothetical protein
MNKRRHGNNTGAAVGPRHLRPLLGACTLLLALGAAPPARAQTIFSSGTHTINYTNDDSVVVSGTTTVVNVVAGGSISGVVLVDGGTVNISGGSISNGVAVGLGTVDVFGCNLVASGGVLTGILLDGTPINTPVRVYSPGMLVLHNQCTPSLLASMVTQLVTDPSVAQGLIDKQDAIAASIAQGDAPAKANLVAAFIHQVQAQTGKSITPADAATLIQLVSTL